MNIPNNCDVRNWIYSDKMGLYFIENLDMEIELYDIINPRH